MPEYPCPGPVAVEAQCAAGTLTLHAEERTSVHATVAAADDRPESQQAAESTRITYVDGTLTVTGPEPSRWLTSRLPQLAITVHAPGESSVRVRVVTAAVTCHGQWSRASLSTASGDGDVEQVTGDLTMNSAGGCLRVGTVGGALSVKTASGDVHARRVGGHTDVKTASGAVRLGEAGADVTVKSASGDVAVDAARHGTVRLTSASGDLSVGVLPGTGVWLDLHTLTGQTRSDLPVREHPSDAAPTTDHGTMAGDQGAVTALTVQLRSISGDVRLHRADTTARDTAPAPTWQG